MTKKEGLSRRDFLKNFLAGLGIILIKDALQLPEWIEDFDEPTTQELAEICSEILLEDEVLDVFDQEDLETALGLVFTLLIEHGENPEQYLIMKDFLQ